MRKFSHRFGIGLLGLAFLAGCGSSSHDSSRPAAALTFEGGPDQSAAVGAPLQITVHVLDDAGRPVPGQAVNFYASTDESAPLTIGTDISKSNGAASVLWTLGTRAGVVASIEVRAVNSAGAPLSQTLRVTATAGAPTSLSTNFTHTSVAHSFKLQFSVQVTNRYGDPVPDAPVAFTPAPGSGSTAPETVKTNENGWAWTDWTLGPANGPQSVTAQTSNLDPLQVTVVARDPSTAELAAGTWDMTLTPDPANDAVRCAAESPPTSLTVLCSGDSTSCSLFVIDSVSEPVVAADGTFDGCFDPSHCYSGARGSFVADGSGNVAASGTEFTTYYDSTLTLRECAYSWTAVRR